MSVRTYGLTTSVIFLLVAVVHLLRLLGQWDVVVGGWRLSMWVSVIGVLVPGFLSYAGVRLVQTHRVALFK